MSRARTVNTVVRDGRLQGECFSLAGDKLCEVSLAEDSTLEDVVEALKPKLGLPKAYFEIYVYGEIIVDRHQLAREHGQFTVSPDCFGPCRKYLAAMSKRAFYPQSEHFDVTWTQRSALDVDQSDVTPFLQSLGVSNRIEAVRVMQVLERLTSPSEQYQIFNLAWLQTAGRTYECLKHAICEHWLHVARNAAQAKVPSDPEPLLLIIRMGAAAHTA